MKVNHRIWKCMQTNDNVVKDLRFVETILSKKYDFQIQKGSKQ